MATDIGSTTQASLVAQNNSGTTGMPSLSINPTRMRCWRAREMVDGETDTDLGQPQPESPPSIQIRPAGAQAEPAFPTPKIGSPFWRP